MAGFRLLVPFLFAGWLAAQTTLLLPGSHAQREGTGTTNVPFGRSSATRMQCVYDGLLQPQPVTITALALRLDGGATAAGKQVDCEIWMGTAAQPLVALSPDFATNRGPDLTVVLPRQTIALPALPTASSPGPWTQPIALTTPFRWQPANGGLLIEVVVHQQTPGSYALDTTYVCDSPELAIGPAACVPAVGVALRVESATTQVIWGRPWVARILAAEPGALVTLVLGQSETGVLFGQPLPANLSSLGAPNCFVSIDIAGSFFAVAQNDGTATFPFAIPNQPSAVGVEIRYQAGELRPGANSLGIITSQAHKVAVCGWEPVGRVWAGGLTATAGTREIGVAPVVRLTVQ